MTTVRGVLYVRSGLFARMDAHSSGAQGAQTGAQDAQTATKTGTLTSAPPRYRSTRPREEESQDLHPDIKRAKEKDAAKVRAQTHRDYVKAQLARIPGHLQEIKELTARIASFEQQVRDDERETPSPPERVRGMGGIAEAVCVVVGRYPRIQALKAAVDHTWCAEDKGFAKRGTFGDDLQEQEYERFQWTSVKQCSHKDVPELQAFIDHVLGDAPNMVLRSRGQHGRGIQILDSGN